MYKRILVATDGSSLSNKAVKGALDLASSVGAEVVALNVVPRYPISYFEGAIGISPKDVASTEKAWHEKGEGIVDAVVDDARGRDVKAKPVVMRSDLVGETVIAAARKHKCDLVVMASHGRKGIKRVLLGSETQHVLTHSHVPVLVLR